MKLRERLERILGETAGMEQPGRAVPIEEAVAGKVLRTEQGPCYSATEEYPLDYRCGARPIQSALFLDSEHVCVAAKDDGLTSFDARSCVFLDTETTGLAGGSGTYPFLIGLGFFRSKSFVVHQLFMRDYDEEAAVLSALSDLLGDRKFVVTYNGKSFDVPLIETRMIMNGLKRVFDDMHSLDLLHAARRVWGKRLSDCRLTTIEEKVMGLHRGHDIPGEEIPERYFHYIRSQDASGLGIVFEHNRSDILMLPVLLGYICEAISDVACEGLRPLDLYSIGAVYDSLKRRDETLPFYTRALKGLRGTDRTMVACRLGMAYKRLGRWGEAVSIWKGLLGNGIYEPYEELAKYYEHVDRDYTSARKVVCDALDVFVGCGHEEGLRHRLLRIERKLSAGVAHEG
jgi:uncharacterized protein YprB with RNaseH-like and TPR domain